MCARKLDRKDGPTKKSDPYFLIKTADHLVYRSEVIKQKLNPKWNPFILNHEDFHKDWSKKINIQVIDWDEDGEDDDIGSVDINLKDILSGRWFHIPIRRTNISGAIYISQVTIMNQADSTVPFIKEIYSQFPTYTSSVFNLPLPPTIQMTFSAAKLKAMDSAIDGGKSDPYFIVYSGNNPVYKSEVVKRSLYPRWKSVNFPKEVFNTWDGSITVKIYDSDDDGGDDYSGEVKISLNNIVIGSWSHYELKEHEKNRGALCINDVTFLGKLSPIKLLSFTQKPAGYSIQFEGNMLKLYNSSETSSSSDVSHSYFEVHTNGSLYYRSEVSEASSSTTKWKKFPLNFDEIQSFETKFEIYVWAFYKSKEDLFIGNTSASLRDLMLGNWWHSSLGSKPSCLSLTTPITENEVKLLQSPLLDEIQSTLLSTSSDIFTLPVPACFNFVCNVNINGEYNARYKSCYYIHLKFNKKTVYKTDFVKQKSTPSFEVIMNTDAMQNSWNSIIDIELYDYNKNGTDELVGSVSVKLRDLVIGEWWKLNTTNKHATILINQIHPQPNYNINVSPPILSLSKQLSVDKPYITTITTLFDTVTPPPVRLLISGRLDNSVIDRKPDPYFEVYDYVGKLLYRSEIIKQKRNAKWSKSYFCVNPSDVNFSWTEKFTIKAYDFEFDGDHELLGEVKISLYDLFVGPFWHSSLSANGSTTKSSVKLESLIIMEVEEDRPVWSMYKLKFGLLSSRPKKKEVSTTSSSSSSSLSSTSSLLTASPSVSSSKSLKPSQTLMKAQTMISKKVTEKEKYFYEIWSTPVSPTVTKTILIHRSFILEPTPVDAKTATNEVNIEWDYSQIILNNSVLTIDDRIEIKVFRTVPLGVHKYLGCVNSTLRELSINSEVQHLYCIKTTENEPSKVVLSMKESFGYKFIDPSSSAAPPVITQFTIQPTYIDYEPKNVHSFKVSIQDLMNHSGSIIKTKCFFEVHHQFGLTNLKKMMIKATNDLSEIPSDSLIYRSECIDLSVNKISDTHVHRGVWNEFFLSTNDVGGIDREFLVVFCSEIDLMKPSQLSHRILGISTTCIRDWFYSLDYYSPFIKSDKKKATAGKLSIQTAYNPSMTVKTSQKLTYSPFESYNIGFKRIDTYEQEEGTHADKFYIEIRDTDDNHLVVRTPISKFGVDIKPFDVKLSPTSNYTIHVIERYDDYTLTYVKRNFKSKIVFNIKNCSFGPYKMCFPTNTHAAVVNINHVTPLNYAIPDPQLDEYYTLFIENEDPKSEYRIWQIKDNYKNFVYRSEPDLLEENQTMSVVISSKELKLKTVDTTFTITSLTVKDRKGEYYTCELDTSIRELLLGPHSYGAFRSIYHVAPYQPLPNDSNTNPIPVTGYQIEFYVADLSNGKKRKGSDTECFIEVYLNNEDKIFYRSELSKNKFKPVSIYLDYLKLSDKDTMRVVVKKWHPLGLHSTISDRRASIKEWGFNEHLQLVFLESTQVGFKYDVKHYTGYLGLYVKKLNTTLLSPPPVTGVVADVPPEMGPSRSFSVGAEGVEISVNLRKLVTSRSDWKGIFFAIRREGKLLYRSNVVDNVDKEGPLSSITSSSPSVTWQNFSVPLSAFKQKSVTGFTFEIYTILDKLSSDEGYYSLAGSAYLQDDDIFIEGSCVGVIDHTKFANKYTYKVQKHGQSSGSSCGGLTIGFVPTVTSGKLDIRNAYQIDLAFIDNKAKLPFYEVYGINDLLLVRSKVVDKDAKSDANQSNTFSFSVNSSHVGGEDGTITIKVFDYKDDGNHSVIGVAQTTLRELLLSTNFKLGVRHSSSCVGGFKLLKIIEDLELMTVQPPLAYEFDMKAFSLDKKDGVLSKNDPYLTISRASNNEIIKRTEYLLNSSSPNWSKFIIPATEIGQLNSEFIIRVYDWDEDGKHDLIGELNTQFIGITFSPFAFALRNEKKVGKSQSGTIFINPTPIFDQSKVRSSSNTVVPTQVQISASAQAIDSKDLQHCVIDVYDYKKSVLLYRSKKGDIRTPDNAKFKQAVWKDFNLWTCPLGELTSIDMNTTLKITVNAYHKGLTSFGFALVTLSELRIGPLTCPLTYDGIRSGTSLGGINLVLKSESTTTPIPTLTPSTGYQLQCKVENFNPVKGKPPATRLTVSNLKNLEDFVVWESPYSQNIEFTVPLFFRDTNGLDGEMKFEYDKGSFNANFRELLSEFNTYDFNYKDGKTCGTLHILKVIPIVSHICGYEFSMKYEGLDVSSSHFNPSILVAKKYPGIQVVYQSETNPGKNTADIKPFNLLITQVDVDEPIMIEAVNGSQSIANFTTTIRKLTYIQSFSLVNEVKKNTLTNYTHSGVVTITKVTPVPSSVPLGPPVVREVYQLLV
eukprot:TRINITY_DN7824_c0_g1_i1.p1 TRINITY_DN7824_c0_g1~~TRINITY_DN7824_c0_g1_i1.p1  ORF type:complete len:2345 (-),score=492.92 TRINITY_DN7824_c0_g1_i1:135-7169(-)